jgi:hypothetical protein
VGCSVSQRLHYVQHPWFHLESRDNHQQESGRQKLDYNYRAALRQSQIALKDGLLIYRKPIAGLESYARLQLVPAQYHNVVFVAFHTNPIGGHLNASWTFHRIRLCFYWPEMYAYITRMCSACPGCALANPTRAKS